ncbi:MAG: flippase activity-associated protein Agl23 [Chloroflexia bacterium]
MAQARPFSTVPEAGRPSIPAGPVPSRRGVTVETLLYLLILALALLTRFALLDQMALHHDEGIHALFGWNIYRGYGWVHDAVYHGPLIYHAAALSYFLFGDSDATFRLILAVFGTATVMLPVLLRRYLGRWGALLASFLLLISPTFLYFGRFGHPDVFGAFFTLLFFVCVVRYVGERRDGWLYGAVVVTCLHFCAKPTAYLATAVFLLFLVARVLWERYGLHAFWPLLGLFPAALEDLWQSLGKGTLFPPLIRVLGLPLSALSLGALLAAGTAVLAMLLYHLGECRRAARSHPALDLVVLLLALVLPLLSAIPLNALIALRGLPPLGYNSTDFPSEVVPLALIAVGATFAFSLALGLFWDSRRFALAAGLFWGIFFVLHTSFFQSMTGWATGLLQPLGFWLTQQEVKRIHVGPQYFIMLISVYEPVSLLFGTLGVLYFAWKGLTQARPVDGPISPAPPAAAPGFATGLLAFWAPLTLFLYSFAGEQTPWLNVHPALPFLLLAGTFLGRVIAARPEEPGLLWRWLRRGWSRPIRPRAGGGRRRAERPGEGEPGPAPARLWADRATFLLGAGLLLWAGRTFFARPAELFLWLVSAAILLGLAYLAFFGGEARRSEAAFLLLGLAAVGMFILGATSRSFGWPAEHPQEAYGDWYALYVPLAIAAATLLIRALLVGKPAWRSAALLLLAFLGLYSFGSAFRLTYLNNDTPVEMLIYVQTSSDLQWAIDEVSTLSTLTTGGRDLTVLYESEVAWPLEWYLRNYPNRALAGATITPASLQQHPDAAVLLTYRTFGSESTAFLEKDFAPTRYYAFNWWFPEEIYRNARTFVERLAPELLQEHENRTAVTERASFLLPTIFSQAHRTAVEAGRLPLGPAGPLLILLRPSSFPSGYSLLGQVREVGLGDVFQVLLNPSGQARIWRYLLFRQIPSPLGAREFAVYIRRDLALPLEWLKDDIPRR